METSKDATVTANSTPPRVSGGSSSYTLLGPVYLLPASAAAAAAAGSWAPAFAAASAVGKLGVTTVPSSDLVVAKLERNGRNLEMLSARMKLLQSQESSKLYIC